MKGESVEMKKVKKLFVLVLIAGVLSLGLTGCKDKSEHPTGDHPSSEQSTEKAATQEHPSGEHPTEEAAPQEHPAGEHPTGEKSAEEHPAGEHPTGEHPK